MASEELVLNITANDQATGIVEELQARVNDLAGETTEINVGLTATDEATEIIEGVEEQVGNLDGEQAEVEVEADDNATDALEDVEGLVDDIDGTEAEVTVQADVDEATSSIDSLIAAMSNMSGKAGGLGKLLSGGGGTLALVGGLGAAFGAAAVSAYEFTQQVEDLSLFTQDSTEHASRLLAVLQDFTDIELGQLTGLIGKMTDKLAVAPELAERLGINIEQARGQGDLFVQVVDALNSGQLTATDRITTAIDIFGRKGARAVNEIEASLSGPLADAMAEIAEERIISPEDIERADKMEASLGKLKGSLAGIAQNIGEPLFQIFQPLINLIAEGASFIPTITQPLVDLISGEQLRTGEISAQFDDLVQLIASGTEAADAFNIAYGNMVGFEDFQTQIEDVNAMLERGITLQEAMGEVFGLTGEAALQVAVALGIVEDATSNIGDPRGIDEINASLADLARQAAITEHAWGILIKDMLDGSIDTLAAEEAFSFLQDTLELTDEKMDEIVAAKVAQELDRTTLTTDELTDAMLRLQDPLTILPGKWNELIAELSSGNPDMSNTIALAEELSAATGIDADQIIGLADAEGKLREQKLHEQLEADAKAAQELAEAMADLKDTVSNINTDDIGNIASGLEDALDASGAFVSHLSFAENFQHEFDDTLAEAARFGPDLRELLDLQAAGVTITPDITLGELESDDAEFLAWVSSLHNMISEGAVEAFSTGGVDAANAFVQAQAQAIADATGLDISEVYRLMGLPPDGSIDTIIKPIVEAESKADALAILNSLKGVRPDDPLLAYIALQVQTGAIDGVSAEIISLLLAKQLGVDVAPQLQEFTQEEINRAQAILDAAGTGLAVTVPVTLSLAEQIDDPRAVFNAEHATTATLPITAELLPGTVEHDLEELSEDRTAFIEAEATHVLSADHELDEVAEQRKAVILADAATLVADSELDRTADPRPAVITAVPQGIESTRTLLNGVAANRTADIYAESHQQNAENSLNILARDRSADVNVRLPNIVGAEILLDLLARDRTATIHVHMQENPTGDPIDPNFLATLLGNPTATVAVHPVAPPSSGGGTNVANVSIQAGVIGNNFSVERTVNRALRRHQRISGRRG